MVVVVVLRMGQSGWNVVVVSSCCLNYTVRPLRSFRVPPPLVTMEESCFLLMPVSQESGAAPCGSVLLASATDVVLPVQRGATVSQLQEKTGRHAGRADPAAALIHSPPPPPRSVSSPLH